MHSIGHRINSYIFTLSGKNSIQRKINVIISKQNDDKKSTRVQCSYLSLCLHNNKLFQKTSGLNSKVRQYGLLNNLISPTCKNMISDINL